MADKYIDKISVPGVSDTIHLVDTVSGYTKTTGTVTSVGITNGGGLSVSGSPITTSGSITVGHSNSVTAQTTQAVYPIKIDANGHISAYGSAVTIPTVTSSYSSTGTDAVNGTAVNAALQTLDSSISATSGQAISAITITDGKIASSSKISVGETNQNAFSNVKVGSSTIAADSETDTLELIASTGVILTPDTTNDTVTISAGNVSHNDSASAGSATPINADQLQGYTLTTLTNTIKTSILNTIYPIGSVYMNVSNTNPGTLFGGTWELISNVALASEHVFGNGIAFGLTNNGSNKFSLQAAQGGLQTSASSNFGKAVGTGTSGVQNLGVQVIGVPTKTQLGDGNLDKSGLISDTVTVYTWRRTE